MCGDDCNVIRLNQLLHGLCGFNGIFDVSFPEIVLCIFMSRVRHGN